MAVHLVRAKETISRLEDLLKTLACTGEECQTVKKQIDCLWRMFFITDAVCTGGKLMGATGMEATQAAYDLTYEAWKANNDKQEGTEMVCDNNHEIPELS